MSEHLEDWTEETLELLVNQRNTYQKRVRELEDSIVRGPELDGELAEFLIWYTAPVMTTSFEEARSIAIQYLTERNRWTK